MRVSVVSTMYESGPFIEQFYERVSAAVATVTDDFEIILVNDGSPDESLRIALDLHGRDRRVVVLDLSRNFGHHMAMLAGLAESRGDLVFLVDNDLEEDPALFVSFEERMRATGADMVFGVQSGRNDPWARRVSASLFYSVFNRLSDQPFPRNVMTVRLMTRRFVDALLQFEERETQIAGLWELAGFDRVAVVVEKISRRATTYTFGRRMGHLINAVTSFSARPLVLMFHLGMVIVIFAGLLSGYFIFRKFVYGVDTEGFTVLVVTIAFFGGLTVACLGVIGVYLAKVYLETKKRPRTIVRELHRAEDGS